MGERGTQCGWKKQSMWTCDSRTQCRTLPSLSSFHTVISKKSLTLLIAHTARRATIVLVDLLDLFLFALGVATTMTSSWGCYLNQTRLQHHTVPDQAKSRRERRQLCVSSPASLNPAQAQQFSILQLSLQGMPRAVGVKVPQVSTQASKSSIAQERKRRRFPLAIGTTSRISIRISKDQASKCAYPC